MIWENDQLLVCCGNLPFPEFLIYKPTGLKIDGIRSDAFIRVNDHAYYLADCQTDWHDSECLLQVPDGTILKISLRIEVDSCCFTLGQVSSDDGKVLHLDFSGMPLLHVGPDFHYARDLFIQRPWHEAIGPGLARGIQQAGPLLRAIPDDTVQGSLHACIYDNHSCCYLYSSEKYLPLSTRITHHPNFPNRGGGLALGFGKGCLKSMAAGMTSMRDETTMVNSSDQNQPDTDYWPDTLDLRICFTGDLNDDGLVDLCDYQLDLKKKMPDVSELYRDTVWYKIFLGARGRVDTTYDQALELISRVSRMTGGARQIVYLVGYQGEGHDSDYPTLDHLNPGPGSREMLCQLITIARDQYRAIVSLHINLDDAYAEHIGWDPSLISRDTDGSLMKWECFNDKQSYHLSHYFDVQSGKVFNRLKRLLAVVPIRDTIHIDAFRNSNYSWLPGQFIGPQEELYAGMLPIIRFLQKQGIDPTTESQNGMTVEMIGLFQAVLHNTGFWPLLAHNKIVGGGHGAHPVALVEGSGLNSDYTAANLDAGDSQILDEIAERALLYRYFQQRQMVEYRTELNGSRNFARYDDATVARGWMDPPMLDVRHEDVLIADLDTRFVPLDGKLFVWHRLGGTIHRNLPTEFQNRQLTATACDNQANLLTESLIEHTDGLSIELNVPPHVLIYLT